ncbi:hypothetical protein ABG768_020479 [Culter alburnus]|uniref:Ig-like domain-containing protein n=1 Tax=Culter alburnus TaxID=194366 RepID=A0AAW2AYC0_CULAL
MQILFLFIAERHSLYYIYTALSKPVDLPGIYEFSAMGLLDDRQIDYYNSKEKRMIHKQQWMKEKMTEEYWKDGTWYRKRKEDVFKQSLKNLKKRMYQSESDLHVLQWRVGCEAEQQGNEFNFSKGIYEFGYDGENFLSFNITTFQWDTFTDAAQETQKNWKHKPMLNPYIIKYLKIDCVDWLKQYIEYADEELRKTSPPDVHMFIKKSTRDKTKLNLTCLATGFYPKDMMVTIRKTQTSLPEHETYSTGIRPNHDGSFQMRMSLEIKKEEKDEYYCNVTHRTLKEPIINIWGN